MNIAALTLGHNTFTIVQDEQDKRFNKLLGYVLLAFIVVSIVVPYFPVFDIEREKK